MKLMFTLEILQNTYEKEIKYILKIFLRNLYVPTTLFLSKMFESQVEKTNPFLSSACKAGSAWFTGVGGRGDILECHPEWKAEAVH